MQSIMREIVIEIYPGKPGSAPDRRSAGATMIGFQVEILDAVIEQLKNNDAEILTAPQDSLWRRRAVVQDPDGRAIELSEKP
jgi:lactoylglutathione lyase